MKIYQKYIIKKIILNFLFILLIFSAVIIITRFISYIEYINQFGINIIDLFSLTFLLLPELLIYLIPLSFLISLMMSYNNIIYHNELIILKTAGLNNIDISRAIFYFTIYLSIITVIISFFLVPYSNRKFKETKLRYSNSLSNISLKNNIFQKLDNITIFVKDKKNNILSSIFINDNRYNDYQISIYAKKGKVIFDNNEPYFILYDGFVNRVNNNKNLEKNKKKSSRNNIIFFEKYNFNIYKKIEIISINHNNSYIWQLIPYINNNSKNSKYRKELHARIIYPTYSIIFFFISTLFILNIKSLRKNTDNNNIKSVFYCLLYVIFSILMIDMIYKSNIYTIFFYIIFAIIIYFSIKKIRLDNLY